MYIRYFILIVACILCLPVAAQKKSKKEFRAKKQAYMAEKAGLTEEESEKFFPLYFEFQQNKWKINKEARKKIKWEKGVEPTEEEWKEFVNAKAEAKIKIAKLEKSYIDMIQ